MVDYRDLPDVRDGLTRLERVILYCLHVTQKEMGGRNVSSTMLYGRVVEMLDVAEDEFRRALESALRKRPPGDHVP